MPQRIESRRFALPSASTVSPLGPSRGHRLKRPLGPSSALNTRPSEHPTLYALLRMALTLNEHDTELTLF